MRALPPRILVAPLFVASAILCAANVAALAHEGEHHSHSAPLGAIMPSFSPRGAEIAFSYQGAIWRMARGGGSMIQLTDAPGFDVEPAWSPDGERIAFIRGTNSFAGPVHLIRAADGETVDLPRQITAKDKLYFDRGGRRLLSVFRQSGGRFALCWCDVQTGELGPELRADTWGQRFALSHGGDSIALATTQDVRGEQGGNNGPQCDLWIMPAAGGELKEVMRFPGRVYEVQWSADDKSLLVVSNVGGVHNDLWRVPLDNPLRGARKLTFGQADEDRPALSDDGKWLLYTDNRRGPTELVLYDLWDESRSTLSASQLRFKQAAGKLSLKIVDDKNGAPITARVSVQQEGGKHYAPPAALYRMLRDEVHFYCQHSAALDAPAGKYLVKVSRGPEYEIQRQQVEIAAGRTTDITIRMRRWTDQRAAGWYSGESHIHANYGYGQWYNSPRTMLAQCAGEDLIACNFMVANSEADGVFDREYFRGAPDPLSTKDTILYWNEEFRSTIWGHLTLLNLKQLVEPIFTGFAHTTHPHDHPTNADIADLTHDQHAHVNYTHPAHNVKDPYLSAYSAKALPLDVALGKVDSIDVMGSNHVATMPLWYRLLNCGFRVPASAGTDCFLNRIRSRLPGQARVYVRVAGEFNYQEWIDALKAGRTFVTDGPMFEFAAAGKPAGDTIELAAPSQVRVTGSVTSQYPLDRVEVVANGEVVAAVEVEPGAKRVEVDQTIELTRSGWIALRAGGPPHPDQPGTTVFGHTSAVYVEIAGAPVDAAEDAAYFVTWIDRLRADIRRRNRIPSRHQVHVESQIAAAREVFNQLLEGGK